MEIKFHKLTFQITKDNRVMFQKTHLSDNSDSVEAQDVLFDLEAAGGPANGTVVQKYSAGSCELKYVSHVIDGNILTILQRSDRFEVVSRFESYEDTNAIRVTQEIKNISEKAICLEVANTLALYFSDNPIGEKREWYLHRFTNARYTESLPIVQNFYDIGLSGGNSSFRCYNVGHQSTKDYLPQAIIENRKTGEHFMFQIESFFDWYYEIGILNSKFYLKMGGPNAQYHAWNRFLEPGEIYQTMPIAICSGDGLNAVLAEMTRYRRHLKKAHEADKDLPVIFNEYMHLAWDDPYAERTAMLAPYLAKAGCKYYVVDCGWHSDVTSLDMYRNFGTWYESKRRFPEGLRKTAEMIRSLGMRFGVWIGPEIVGIDNKEMIDYYGDECFLTRNGEKIRNETGYLLDYRQPKVIQSMSEAFERMVNEYGIDYIKYDGLPYSFLGTDKDSTSLGSGLEDHVNAFLKWTQDMMEKYPHVIFEDCAGGGQRLDYKALSMFQLASTSDQTDYLEYPYIVGNIFCSVLPEQAGVWSYPVESAVYDAEHEDTVNEKVTKEHVVLNMINSMLGRIHLASRIQLLDEEKQALIQEGIEVYNRMTPDKLQAVPYLPKGYAQIDDKFVAVGLKTEEKVYLGVWNLQGKRHVELPLPEISVKDVSVAYPQNLETKYSFDEKNITIDFTEDEQARLFELSIIKR